MSRSQHRTKRKELVVTLRAQAIECRMVGDGLKLEAVGFHLIDEGDAGVPQLVICFERGVKQVEAVDMLRAVIERIEGDRVPSVKVAVPSEIIDLVTERELPLQAILQRLNGLPDHVRDCLMTYIDELGKSRRRDLSVAARNLRS